MVRETRHLWVGNLPDNIREDRIREHFKRYGRVQNVKLLAKGAGGPEGGATPGSPSGLCAAVAFMDIKSAAKAHGAEHTLDERLLTTVYYEPAAIPSSASAGSSPAGSGYSASSGSVNSTSRYPNHGGGSEERCSRTGPTVSSGGSGGGGGGGVGAGAGGAGPGAYSSPAADRARPRDRLYRNGPTSYINNNNNSIIDRGSQRRWYGYASPEGGGYTGSGSRRGRARSGSSSAASNSSRSDSTSSAPRSPSSSSEGASSPENRSKKHQWSSSTGNRPLAICVKNLPQRSSDSSLKDGLFHEYKKHGKVSSVKVVGVNQDRYAIVRFKKPSDVEKALEVSQDKLFFGCKISVSPYQGMDVEDNESRPYETDLDEFHPKATRTLFIGNLEKDVSPTMLREKFKHFGKILEIDIKKQTGGAAGYAFCQYANISSVVEAIRSMDGEHIGSSRVKLGFGKSMATNYVWIDGITESATQKHVISHCGNIGTVVNAKVNKATGHALVVFDQVAAAQLAVKELRGLSVRGRKLQVDFASRECQEAFYEQAEKCSSSGVNSNDRFTDIPLRGFESTTNRYSRYETQRRPPTTINSYTARSSRSSRYQNNTDHFEDFSDRRYRYEEFSGGSGSEAGTGGGYESSVGPALQSVVVVSGSAPSSHTPTSNMRHLQKERVHLLEQLEECQSSGDELVSPKKKFKADKISLGRRPSGDASRYHRDISPSGKKRRGSETSKHHWRSPTPLSRSGTPLRDERPDSPIPTEPRRATPANRTQPMCLPLPRFAAQVLARVLPTSPLQIPDGISAPASPLVSLAVSRVPSPASSPGSSPSPAEPSLDERIRSLDERYEKWSGSRVAVTECPEKSRFRPRLLDLDINEVQPSEVMRSVLAKRSVFDEDTKRLEGICDKFEPIRTTCSFSSPSSARLSPSPMNSPQSAGRSPYAGSPVVASLKLPTISTAAPPVKGLQYPFPSHPPSGLDGALPPPAPSEGPECDSKKVCDLNVPRNSNSNSERGSGSFEIMSPGANVFTSPNSWCSKPEQRMYKNSDGKSPPFKDTSVECEATKCDDKLNIIRCNSDSLDRRKCDYFEEIQNKTINIDVFADEIRDQSFKSNILCEKSNVDKVICDVKHQDVSLNINKRSVVDSTKSETIAKVNCSNISESSHRRRPSVDEREYSQTEHWHRKEENDRRKKEEARESLKKDSDEIALSKTNSKDNKDIVDKEKFDRERKEKERAEKEKLEKERTESERKEKERIETERKENLRLEKERIEKERAEKIEKERLEKERIESERLEKEKAERERLLKEKQEAERIAKERQEREKLEKERREKELEKERREKELEKERREKEKAEKEKLQRLENERKERADREKKEKQDKERLEKEKLERLDTLRREKDILDREKSEKLDSLHENKLDRQERRKEKIEKDSRKDRHEKDVITVNDSNRDRRKEKDDAVERSERHRHSKDAHRRDGQLEGKRDSKTDNGKTKEYSRKLSRDESSREITRKDSSDSTTSRHSHDSVKSKDHDLIDIKEESRHSSKPTRHNVDNYKGRHHDKDSSTKHIKDEDAGMKSLTVDKNKDENLFDPANVIKDKHAAEGDKHRHYSLDSHNEIKISDSKRKERLNSSCSLPSNVGTKRRVSSQDSLDFGVEDIKKPRLNSDTKKLSERRDSKDSVKHSDKNKHAKSSKNNLFKHSEIKEDKKCIKEEEKSRSKESKEKEIKDPKDKDTKELVNPEKELKSDTISETKPDISDTDSRCQIDVSKSKERRISKELEDLKSESFASEDAESDHKAFFSRLELRSSEEDEKQRAQKEKMKEIKRIQQIKQIERLMQHQENKKLKNEDRKKEMKDKRLSNERKSREDKVDTKKSRKLTNSSDTSDSDEPKKHSIFDIVDEGPTYISMYDKVKARSCKNMQKQEEEKRQEKIKAKFNQFKQCRAKREEKKRSTSWDEDSDSEQEHKKSTSKSLIASSSEDEYRRRHKEIITTDSENDHEKSKPMRKLLEYVGDESPEDNHKKAISRKKSHSRIVSDTSDDESFKKCIDIKKYSDQSKFNTMKTIKKEKNSDVKPETDGNIYDIMNSEKSKFLAEPKLIEPKLPDMADIKNEPIYNTDDSFSNMKIPLFDLKSEFNDDKLHNYKDMKYVTSQDFKSIKYEDIKPAHCDISSEGEGIVSDSMKMGSYSENRKRHKKKQKRQKSYPFDDEAKSDYHEKMQIINSMCNSKSKEHLEKKKHSNKKDRKREKIDNFDALFEKEKSSRKPKKTGDAGEFKVDQGNIAKREDKMQDIFGPFSDESDACNKEFPPIIDNQVCVSSDKNSSLFSPKVTDFDSNHGLQMTDFMTKDKSRDEIKRKREKKRKDRKSIHKDDDNSLDVDAAGKAIEASLFDETADSRQLIEKVDLTSNTINPLEQDVFRFTDGDDSVEFHSHHNSLDHAKKEGKERKKKKKKNKENRQERKDYHHYHHDKVDLVERDTKLSDVFQPNTNFLEGRTIEVVDITQKVECKPPLTSPSLPILIDSPPQTESASTSTPSPTICKELSSSPPCKSATITKPTEIRRLSEKFIPGFGTEIDENISESAVKSISDFENSVSLDRKVDLVESNINSAIESSHKNETKLEEKARAIISQEETEDAVAALLGESFGGRNDAFSDCYNENTQSPAHTRTSPGTTEHIPEDEAEEMRQAVQSLNASELEVKPDTPQSENDLQIDTDTDEGDDNSQSKTLVDSKSVSNSSTLTSDSEKAKKNNLELPLKPVEQTSTSSVISKGWTLSSHKTAESPLLISAPLQTRDDKGVHIGPILQFIPQQMGHCSRPILSSPSKISTSYQVVNSITRPPGNFSNQPPTIKIPADHIMYQRQPGIVISPRMSGDIRLHSPKAHGDIPQKITNMTILTTGSPSLHSPPGLHSPSGIQQRSPSQITVVRMQQPPLSPIQTAHLPISNQSRSILSPGPTNTILIQNPNTSVQLNRLTPVLAPISKPIQPSNVSLQQSKTAVTSGTSAIVHPPKGELRTNQDIVIAPKLLISSPVLGSAQNATIMAQNRLMSASGNFPTQLPVLMGSNIINKSITNERTSNMNGPILSKMVQSPLQISTNKPIANISSDISKSYQITPNISQQTKPLIEDSIEQKKTEIETVTSTSMAIVGNANLVKPSQAVSTIQANPNTKLENLDNSCPTKTEINKELQIAPADKVVHEPKLSTEKPKCETDFEELLKQSACESKIEKPQHMTLQVSTVNENISNIDDNSTNHSASSQHNASIINDPISNSKDSNDSKEDSDYWSAKEVNIDSVIKKVDALCSASELSDDSEHAKGDWAETSEPKDIKEIKIDQEKDSQSEITTKLETVHKDETLELVDTVDKSGSKSSSTKRGGRARGRKISEGATERVQTRQGTKPTRGTTMSPRRGRGRVKADKKVRSSNSPGVHLPADVYDFHEDSGDELNEVPQNKTESRPRLILTIKSPLTNNTVNTSSSSTIISSQKSTTGQTVKDEKPEEFISPAANTRKSRRLQEKDVTRNTVDDIIEDVVKNTGLNKFVNSKDGGPVRRSTRQNITKPDKGVDVRKSPRATKKQKERRNSETSADSSDEKIVKKDPLEITESETKPVISDQLSLTETSCNISTVPVSVSQTTNVITKPPKKMINEINAKLSTLMPKSIVENQIELDINKETNNSKPVHEKCSIAIEESIKDDAKKKDPPSEFPEQIDRKVPEDKVNKTETPEELMLDPATGEMIYMKRGADGILVPVPSSIKPSNVSKVDVSKQLPSNTQPVIQATCITTRTVPEESVVKSPSMNAQPPKLQIPLATGPAASVKSSPIFKSAASDMGTVSTTVAITSVVTSVPSTSSHILTTSSVMSAVSLPPKSAAGTHIITSSHIVSTANPTPAIISSAVPKTSAIVSKTVTTKEIYGQYPEGIQQHHLVVKTSGGAVAGMKIGPGPLSPHTISALPPKGMNQISDKPAPIQSQIALPNKQVLVRPGCGGSGPGQLGPSLPRGAQGQHASPPLHKHHATSQPIIAGANSTRVAITAVPSISPQGQLAMQPGILVSPPPAHQQTSPVTPGEGIYPHFAHQHYQHYYRTHQDPRTTPSPYVARSPLGAEGSEAPSPPLELRRLPGARVPHTAQSPSLSDRSTDSPQVSVYSNSSSSRYSEAEGGRYYEAPSPVPAPPPPAHTPHRTALHHRILLQSGMGIDGGSAGEERGPSRGNAPAQGGAGLGRIQPGPPHAAHAPREADSLMMLLRRYPVMWQGLMALKNDAAAVQMHFVHGNPAVASNTLPSNGDGSTPLLRIAQRMRLEPVQLEAVARKMQMENEHCMLLALPCGRDHLDVLQQSTHLNTGFITYLRRKLAAGIVNVAPPGHHQPLYTVHIFPSCEFANENLERIAPDLLHRVTDIAHLLIVIATV